MGGHFHIRRTSPWGRQSVEATRDPERVERIKALYENISTAQAAQLEIEDDCSCDALGIVPCPICELQGPNGEATGCEFCKGKGTVERQDAEAYYQQLDSISSRP